MAMVIAQAHQIKNLTVMVQNLSTLFQDHLESLAKREDTPARQPKRLDSEEKKSYAEIAAQQELETPGKGKKKNKGKRKAEEGPTPPRPPTAKQLKGEEQGESSNQGEWKKVEGLKRQSTATIAKRKIFATRITAKPLSNPVIDEARISMALSKVLVSCVCKAPTNLQVSSNRLNGTITITTPPGSDSGQYTRYLEKMTETLNEANPEGEPAYLPFRRVPTDVNVLVHGIPLDAIPSDPTDLDTEIKLHFKESHRIDLTSAKFLKADPASREGKKATSIMLRLPEADAIKITPQVVIMGKMKESRVMWHATPTTQCTRCWKFGHPKIGCREKVDICPICSKTHVEKEHKCYQTSCRGHKKLIPGCCNMTPAKCPTCGGPHSAKDKDCPVRIQVKEQERERYDRRMASLADVGMTGTQQ